MKKGYAIMLDAVVALSLVLVILTAFYGNYLFRITQTSETSYKNLHYISEDALDTVPQSYRDASLALGATEWQTIWWVTLPAAKSGVLTAIMLGIGRAIGETMVVLMVTGNAATMPRGLNTLFNSTRTMTATIAAEMGEVANGSTHYHMLFFIGIILFIIALIVNVTASTFVFRRKKRSERILS